MMAGERNASSSGGNTLLPILSLAVGTFGIGCGEFTIMAILPEVAHSLQASIAQCGNIISAYALGVVVGAPILSLASASMSRKTLLLLLTFWFSITTILGTTAHSVLSLEIWRFIAGLPHGTLFGSSALTAAGLVGAGREGRAVGHVFAGLTVANVIGAPLAGWAGEYFGWRLSYDIIGVIGLIAMALIWRFVPQDYPHPGRSVIGELEAFRRKQVWQVLAIVVLGCGGMFSVYTYFAAALQEVTKVPAWTIPFYQSLWGLGMFVGAYVGANAIDRNPFRATVGAFIWSIATLIAFAVTLPYMGAVTVVVFLMGGMIAIGPGMQVRLISVAGDAQTMAASLNHAAFNMANAIGAWVGEAALVAGMGYASTGWAGAMIAVMGLALFLWFNRSWEASAKASRPSA